MGFFNNFPYTNFHEINLDWLIKEMVNLKNYIEKYTAVNKVSYYGIWDITKQYPQWAVVSNGDKSYMSSKAVPQGIDIVNGDFWIELADLDPRYGGLVTALEALTGSVESLTGKVESLTRNDESLTSKVESLANNKVYSFDTVEDMKSTADIAKDTIAFCAGRNGYTVLTAWYISDTKKDLVSVQLMKGLWANYLHIDPVDNVLGLGVLKSPESCTELVNSLLVSDEYNKLYFPAGEYKISALVRNTVQIEGSNQSQYAPDGGEFIAKYDTIFYPDGGPAITIDAENTAITNCIIRNLEIVGDGTTKNPNNDGIKVKGSNDTEFCDYFILENLLIRNCDRGVAWNARGIWNTFNNVRVYGNLSHGFVSTPPSGCTFNHNSFNDCQFANNGACGIYMSNASEYRNCSNYFNHCNIESNYYQSTGGSDRFAIFLFNCRGATFNCCYFEANVGDCVFWLNGSDVTIEGGSTIIPKNPLVGCVNGSKAIIIGLSGFETGGQELCAGASEANSVCVIGKTKLGYKTTVGNPTLLW